MKTYPSFRISRPSVRTANYSTFDHFAFGDVVFLKFSRFFGRNDVMPCAQALNMPSKMVGSSNCSGAEVFACYNQVKGKVHK